MKKSLIAVLAFVATFAGLTAIAVVTQTGSAIDTMINDKDFKSEVITKVNANVTDVTALTSDANGVTFTNTIAASVTNLSVIVIDGKVTSVTINGTTKP